MIRCFAFDIGNVIWNFEEPLTQLRRRHASLLGIDFNLYRQKYQEVYQGFETGTLDVYSWSRPINPHAKDSEINRCFKNALSLPRFQKYLNSDMVQFLRSLNSKFTLLMLSNAENYLFPYIHRRLSSLFDHLIISWQVGFRKPDPQIYQQIFKYGSWKPEEVIFVDDKEENVLGAQALGINGVLFEGYPKLLSELKKYQITVNRPAGRHGS